MNGQNNTNGEMTRN